MARSAQSVNVPVLGAFAIYTQANPPVPVTGLAQSDFTSLMARNNADMTPTLTITEIGSGRYGYRFTPTLTGYYHVLIRQATHNPRGEQDEFDVS